MSAVGYRIIATRLPSSVFGPGRAHLKGGDGQPQVFASLEDAVREADRLNGSLRTPNVFYTADPDPYPISSQPSG